MNLAISNQTYLVRFVSIIAIAVCFVLLQLVFYYDSTADLPPALRLRIEQRTIHKSPLPVNSHKLINWIPISNINVSIPCLDVRYCEVMKPLHVTPCINQHNVQAISNHTIVCDGVIVSKELINQALDYRIHLVNASTAAVTVLIEGRERYVDIKLIEYALSSILQHTPSDWRIRLFIKPSVIQFFNQLGWFMALTRVCDKIVVHALPEGVNDSRAQYNKFVGSTHFWAALSPSSHIHLTETDSGYCSSSTRQISSYLKYDYCGARWRDNNEWACRKNTTRDDTRCCCNSGFSIWNRSMMLQLTLKFEKNVAYRAKETLLIDRFWAEKMSQTYPNAKMCEPVDADLFSAETIMVDRDVPIGFHKPLQNQWTVEQRAHFSAVCPAWDIIQSLTRNATAALAVATKGV